MSAVRIIKKYPNRRLYDTTESRYIRLNDIRQLVLKDEPFAVIDKKTNEPITRTILLQVIAEQEQQGRSMMSEVFLAQIIRACDGSVSHQVSGHLEQSLALFLEQLPKRDESMPGAVGNSDGATDELARQNADRARERREQMPTSGSGAARRTNTEQS